MRIAVITGLCCVAVLAAAAQPEQTPAPSAAEISAPPATSPGLEPIPDGAPAAPDGDFEPEVTIIQRGEDRIEEFRAGGFLYAVRIVPQHGAPYYLVDTDGDGEMDSRRSEFDPNFSIPQWVILRW